MKRMKMLFLYGAGIVIAAVGLLSCRGGNEWHTSEGVVWNTTYRITYSSPYRLDDSIQSVFRRIELSLSPFNPDSRISRINRGETDVVDSLIAVVFAASQKVNSESGGRFDPTVSPLVNLWGFGYTGRPADGVDPDVSQVQIDSALAFVGIDACRLLPDGRLEKKSAGTTFNFSAITKGFGCDLVGEMLERNGSANYMVEIGGEIAVKGANPDGRKWRIQVDAPVEDMSGQHSAMRIIELADCGIATSGNYRNFRDTRSAGRIGHTIDPVSGRPFRSDLLSATVVAPTCGLADAYATACMASASSDAAMRMIDSIAGVSVLLVVSEGDSMRISVSEGFPRQAMPYATVR